METQLPLVSTLAVAFGLALAFGYLAERFKIPALVGYLLAGIAAGLQPFGPAADFGLAHQLSEIGIMLLMFGVGLHFSVSDLLRVKGIAVPGAVMQMTCSTLLGILFAWLAWPWSPGGAVCFGLCVSCASTVVVTKALGLRGQLNTVDGQIAVGWLVVEDIAAVLILVLLPPFAQIMNGGEGGEVMSAADIAIVVGLTVLRVVCFVVVMLIFGRKIIPWALWKITRTGSRELFTLFILACAIGIAFGASLVFSVSFALGAFFAGMVMRESRYAKRAAENSLPLQDAFSVLFFTGVGMMLDWHVFLEHPGTIFCLLFIIIIGNSLVSASLVRLMRCPLHTSLTIGACLSQAGEFSYILAAQGIELGLLDRSVMSLIVAASILSIAVNPVAFKLMPLISRLLLKHFAWARRASVVPDPYTVGKSDAAKFTLSGHAIVVGSSAVTDRAVSEMTGNGIQVVCITDDEVRAGTWDGKGPAVVSGDASDPLTLVEAHVVTASLLVVTETDAVHGRRIIDSARQLNSEIGVLVRVESSDDEMRADDRVNKIFDDHETLSHALCQAVVGYYRKKEAAAEADGSAGIYAAPS